MCGPLRGDQEGTTMKNNIRITLEYDGSRYDGWQKQGNTENTIQGKLEAVLLKMAGEESGGPRVRKNRRGSPCERPGGKFPCGRGRSARTERLRREYSEQVSAGGYPGALSADRAPERFHSRLSASSKTYGYYVETGDKKNVFERKYVYGFGKKLDLEAMRRAAGFLIGEHDFKSFCANRRMKKSTVRRIDEIRIVEHGTKIELPVYRKRLSLQHGADPDGNAPGGRQRNAETGGNEGDPGGERTGTWRGELLRRRAYSFSTWAYEGERETV